MNTALHSNIKISIYASGLSHSQSVSRHSLTEDGCVALDRIDADAVQSYPGLSQDLSLCEGLSLCLDILIL